MNNHYCVVIPSFGHWSALPMIVDALIERGLPIIIVDDGNSGEGRRAIDELADVRRQIEVIHLAKNEGKGVAVRIGLERAFARGFSHALQIDADGQHDLGAIDALMTASDQNPQALVSGRPVYDESIPRGRQIGRWVTHIWVFIETLSLRIIDSMCGFRVYPLASALDVFSKEDIGRRMDFDTDIMVRMFWRGVPPIFVPVKVTYPIGNRSNFRLIEDNILISMMHTRLVLTMILRLPSILRHRPPQTENVKHWSSLTERGAGWGLRLTAWVSRLFGRKLCTVFLLPIVFYFWASGRVQRESSAAYLRKVLSARVGAAQTFKHFFDFSLRPLDAFRAWTGQLSREKLILQNETLLAQAAQDTRGALLIVSHHGNVEIARALLSERLAGRLTSIVHTKHAVNYNQIIARHSGDDSSRMLQVTEFGPETAGLLQERIDKGEWIAIAGDRTPIGLEGRVCKVDFLGASAPFPQGPWLLASILCCPVYLLFCTRNDNLTWSMSFELFAERVQLPRSTREAAVKSYVQAYAQRLEHECRRSPWQWYNFFDFWNSGSRA